MKIAKITFEIGLDFHADLQCEHCNATQHIKTGYHDAYYHSRVIPAITCVACGRNRAGESPARKNPLGTLHVSGG